MGLSRAYKIYGTLNDEQRKIYWEREVAGIRPIDDWLALLRPLAELDHGADLWRAGRALRVALLIVAAIIPVIIFFSMQWFWGVGIVIVLVAGFFIRLHVMDSCIGRDLANSLRMLVIPFLYTLRQDLAPGAVVELSVNLRPGTDADNRTKESPAYAKGNYFKVIDYTYHSRWFQGKAEFADKVRLKWEITDDNRLRVKQKRSPRGKLRVRQQLRVSRAITVHLGFPARRYDLTSRPLPEHMTLAHSAARDVVSASRTLQVAAKVLTTAREEAADRMLGLMPLVELIGEAYQLAVPVKAESAPAAP